MTHTPSGLDELLSRLRRREARPPVAVLGSANLDIVVGTDHLPRPGETVTGSGVRMIPGGKGLNQAVALARSGAVVELLGATGDDDFGRRLRRFLDEDGIDAVSLRVVAEPTGTAHITVSRDGENSIIVVPGANHAVTSLEDAWRTRIGGSAALVTQCELDMGLVAEALRFASGLGVPTVLTPAPIGALSAGLPAGVDILIGNELEIGELGGGGGLTESGSRLSRRVPLVVATLGADGVAWFADGVPAGRLPARRVTAIDTTAAGDTFVGAFVSRLVGGAAVADGIAWATAAAALAVQRPGSAESVPHRDEVEAALSHGPVGEHGPDANAL